MGHLLTPARGLPRLPDLVLVSSQQSALAQREQHHIITHGLGVKTSRAELGSLMQRAGSPISRARKSGSAQLASGSRANEPSHKCKSAL
jgi:hypothetical protein